MGIYLPNMEMPKRGHTITITIVGSGQAYVEYFDCRPRVKETIEYTAVPVPPHGRLIDADAIKETLKPADSIRNYEPEWTWGELYESICVGIDNAPTIIPPSGGKENE